MITSEHLNLPFIYLYRNFELIRNRFTTWNWVDVDSTPCVVFRIVYIYIFRACIIVKPTNAVDVSIIETTAGRTENCNRMVSNTLPGIGSNILPLAWLDGWTVMSTDHLDVTILYYCSTESPSFVVHILLLHHSTVLQVQLPAGIKIATIISPYEVDGTFSCHGSKMTTWKAMDVVYGLRLLCVVVTFHALHSDVFERLSVGFKWISNYAIRLVFNRVFNINLLVLDFSSGFRHTRFDFFARILEILLHMGC